jgi:muramidase (phage lysozyme)
MPIMTAAQAGGANRCAFLDMLAVSEIGAALIAETDKGYNVLVGSTPTRPLTFPSYSTHPNIFNAACDSDAAGRYQLMHRWYQPYASMLKLPDFSPLSQDKIALQQIRECRALPYIDAGQFSQAVAACNHIWASLTGSPYGQHTNPIEMLRAVFESAGGTLA